MLPPHELCDKFRPSIRLTVLSSSGQSLRGDVYHNCCFAHLVVGHGKKSVSETGSINTSMLTDMVGFDVVSNDNGFVDLVTPQTLQWNEHNAHVTSHCANGQRHKRLPISGSSADKGQGCLVEKDMVDGFDLPIPNSINVEYL